VPEENFWTLWCKGRLTEAETPTIRLGTTSSGLTSAHLHHPLFFTGRIPFLPPNQQCQSTEGTFGKEGQTVTCLLTTTTTTTVLRPFVRDYPGEPVPEETLTHPVVTYLLN